MERVLNEVQSATEKIVKKYLLEFWKERNSNVARGGVEDRTNELIACKNKLERYTQSLLEIKDPIFCKLLSFVAQEKQWPIYDDEKEEILSICREDAERRLEERLAYFSSSHSIVFKINRHLNNEKRRRVSLEILCLYKFISTNLKEKEIELARVCEATVADVHSKVQGKLSAQYASMLKELKSMIDTVWESSRGANG